MVILDMFSKGGECGSTAQSQMNGGSCGNTGYVLKGRKAKTYMC